MWSFDGEYKKRPKQSYGGRSKPVDRETLLLKCRLERENRENIKRREHASVVLQAWTRGHLVREKLYEERRKNFDVIVKSMNAGGVPNQDVVEKCLADLLKIFRAQKDYNRLLIMCQQIIKDQKSVVCWITADSCKWKSIFARLIGLCLRMLNFPKVDNASPIHPVLLRMLEILTSPTYLPSDMRQEFLFDLYKYLLKAGYYGHLIQFLITKVPELYETTLKAPTYMADSVMQLLYIPLHIRNTLTDNNDFTQSLIEELCNQVLGKCKHSQIRHYVLPCLAQSEAFNTSLINDMLFALHQKLTLSPPAHCDMWFLVAFLAAMRTEQGFSDSQSFNRFLCVVYYYLERSPLYEIADVVPSEDEDTYGVIAPIAQDNPDQTKAAQACIEELESAYGVSSIMESVEKFVDDSEVMISFSKVFHAVVVAYQYQLHKCRLLYGFVLKRNILLRPMWYVLSNLKVGGTVGNYGRNLLMVLSNGCLLGNADIEVLLPVLSIFCASLTAVLSTLHDSEFLPPINSVPAKALRTSFPFNTTEVINLCGSLRDVCVGLTEITYPDHRLAGFMTHSRRKLWRNCFKVCVGMLRHLHLRDTRRHFCAADHWITKKVFLNAKALDHLIHSPDFEFRELLFSEDPGTWMDTGYSLPLAEQRFMSLMQAVPFVFGFELRMSFFRHAIRAERDLGQGSFPPNAPLIDIKVRRTHLYEDAFDKLDHRNESNLKRRLRVKLINKAGAREAGVDGGGLFREFTSELLKTAFDPNRGFFLLTRDNTLYPNPSAPLIHADYEKHYNFIGRMLGKALYENLLVEIPLAGFVLTKLITDSTSVEFHYLDSLDPDLCRNLLSLKNYDGNVQDLGLDFTVINAQLGENKVMDLIPNGSNIPVTKDNCIEYIYRMADHKLNKQIAKQCQAFKEGVFEVIDAKLLKLFCWTELQMLISGALGNIDIDDLRQHTKYAGIYTQEHPNIVYFWNVVSSFDEEQRKKLIKFVTSCSRPPLLGFKELSPPFSINPSGSEDRLPSAATCMNLLKLPCYNDQRLLKEKLLYAINSGAGFELS